MSLWTNEADGPDRPPGFFSFGTVEALSVIENHAERIVIAVGFGCPKRAAPFFGKNGVHVHFHFAPHLLAVEFFRFVQRGQLFNRGKTPIEITGKPLLIEFFDIISRLKPAQPVSLVLVGVFFHPHEPGLGVGDGFVAVVDEPFIFRIFDGTAKDRSGENHCQNYQRENSEKYSPVFICVHLWFLIS
jgi:hypothetical protein